MSKMGISVISSYRGGCNFEAVGLSRAIVSDFWYVFKNFWNREIGIEKIKKNFMKNLMLKIYLPYLSAAYIDLEKAANPNIKEN